MTAYDRNLIFTALLEEPEFRAMEYGRCQRVLADAQECLDDARSVDPTATIAASMVGYVNAITANHTADPGVWERYVDTMLAGDERRAREAGVTGLPEGMRVVGLMPGSSRR